MLSSLLPGEHLHHAHLVARQPMGEGEAQVAMAPGWQDLDGQSGATEAPLSRLQLWDGQVPSTWDVTDPDY